MECFDRASDVLSKEDLYILINEYIGHPHGDPQVVMQALNDDKIVRAAMNYQLDLLRKL